MNQPPKGMKSQSEEINSLERLCECGIQISTNTQGRKTDWWGQHASLVFVKLCLTCLSLLRMVPGSAFYTSAKNLRAWDLSATASLCRNLIEAYHVLLYVVSPPEDEEDREFKEALWEYHEAFERHAMLSISLPNSKRLPEASRPLIRCRERLQRSSRFQQLSSGYQKELLQGRKFSTLSNIELSKAAGISESLYRAEYKYCSTFAHSSPFSISQLDCFRAGAPDSEMVFGRICGLSAGYMALAIRDYTGFFPDQKPMLPPYVEECISFSEELFRWEKLPSFESPENP